jgi:hypothetical protein
MIHCVDLGAAHQRQPDRWDFPLAFCLNKFAYGDLASPCSTQVGVMPAHTRCSSHLLAVDTHLMGGLPVGPRC